MRRPKISPSIGLWVGLGMILLAYLGLEFSKWMRTYQEGRWIYERLWIGLWNAADRSFGNVVITVEGVEHPRGELLPGMEKSVYVQSASHKVIDITIAYVNAAGEDCIIHRRIQIAGAKEPVGHITAIVDKFGKVEWRDDVTGDVEVLPILER